MFDITLFSCEGINIRNIFCCCRKKRPKKRQTVVICKKIEGEVNIPHMFSKEAIASGLNIVFNRNNEIISMSGNSNLLSITDLSKLTGKHISKLDEFIHTDILCIIDDVVNRTKQEKNTFGVVLKVIEGDVSSEYIICTFPVIQNINSIVYSILLIKQPFSAVSVKTTDIITQI